MPSSPYAQKPNTPYVTTGGTSSPFFPVLRDAVERSSKVDIVVAFTQDSGLRLLQTVILDALDRGSKIRILTSNYLHITQASALQRLLDWKEHAQLRSCQGRIEIRIFESENQSFHPKAWFFSNPTEEYVFVGSSNWSFSALCSGIEWNLRLDRSSDPKSFTQLQSSFSTLWAQAKDLTGGWLREYTHTCQQEKRTILPIGEIALDQEDIIPTRLQEEALKSLQHTITQKQRRGLFVLATGLGKTFLSAFAAKQLKSTRILFLVHRREILLQAASSFRRIFNHSRFGWCIDKRLEKHGDITFGSVQKLSREEHLLQFDKHFFDLIIIDEVHHAAASSYQKIIHHFSPQFLLGVTATPNRSDHLDILPLFDDHIIYQANLWEGIQRNLLVPFRYIGRQDNLNYQLFSRVDGSLDIQKIDLQLQNNERMELVWNYCQQYSGSRTIFFCSSIAHADFCTNFLEEKGLRIVSIHSGASSSPRFKSIAHLREGTIDAIAVVDLCNEGIDIPEIDRIVMLRPTSSPLLFLQQLGRGLRISKQKDQLLVLDIIGNHRAFAARLNALLSLSSRNDFGLWIQGQQSITLPPQCSMDIDDNVLRFFRTALPKQKNYSAALFEQYLFIKNERPSLSTLIQLGAEYTELLGECTTWFSFLEHKKKLQQEELQCYHAHKLWFEMLEKTPITKSFKLIAIQVFLEEGSLSKGLSTDYFAHRCYQNIRNNSVLRTEIPTSKHQPLAWRKYWLQWVHSSWSAEQHWLIIKDDRVWIEFSFQETDLLYDLSFEIIQYRLLQYSLRPSKDANEKYRCAIHKKNNLFAIHLPETTPKQICITTKKGRCFSFTAKDNCIQGRLVQPQLSQLLKETFGRNIKQLPQPLHIYLERIQDQWHVEGIENNIPRFLDRIEIPRYRTFEELKQGNINQFIHLPSSASNPLNSFAIRSPNTFDFITKDDWLVCNKTQTYIPKQIQNKNVLCQEHPLAPMSVAKVIPNGSGFAVAFSSKTIPYSPKLILWGIIENVVPMSSLAPFIGTKVHTNNFSSQIGISETPSETFQAIDGFCFLILKDRQQLPLIEHEPEFVFAFQKKQTYYYYLGLWFWNGERWEIDSLTKNS